MLEPSLIQHPLLPIAIGVVAFLYSSVGHGGATGYLAVAALLGLSPAFARPGALWMNIVVAGIAFLRFNKQGFFSSRIFWPFAVTSIPCAFIGSQMHLEGMAYAVVLAVGLLAAGFCLVLRRNQSDATEIAEPCWAVSLVCGVVLGLLAGMTGIGGGVFLTPLLILMHWSGPKVAGGISALFIVVNSVAGLIGLGSSALNWSPIWTVSLATGVLGALAGTHFGVARWKAPAFQRALTLVLWIAAGKLLLMGK